MNTTWTEVSLSDVFDLDVDAVPVDPSEAYDMTGVLSYGRGLFAKPPVNGSETSYKTFYRLHAGQIVLSQLFGWEGAIAPVDPPFEGRFVSSQFPTFKPKNGVDLRFSLWLLRQPEIWEQLKTAAKGMGDRRRTLSPEIFFGVKSRIPQIQEQQKIAEHLDSVENNLERIKQLRESSEQEALALVRSALHEEHCEWTTLVPMSDLVDWRKPDTEVLETESYTFAGVYSFGRGVFRKEAKSGLDFSYDRLTKLRAREFTYPKLMAWEGALGVVPEDCDGCHVSPEFPVFTIDETKVLPEILDIHFKTPSIWKKLADISTGTNVRRRRLNPNTFLGYQFPLPPMEAQKRIAALSEKLKLKRAIAAKAQKRQDSLLPSLLDKIFNG